MNSLERIINKVNDEEETFFLKIIWRNLQKNTLFVLLSVLWYYYISKSLEIEDSEKLKLIVDQENMLRDWDISLPWFFFWFEFSNINNSDVNYPIIDLAPT